MVSAILDNLVAGQSEQDILRAYPFLEIADTHAAIAYAAELARGRIVPLAEGCLMRSFPAKTVIGNHVPIA